MAKNAFRSGREIRERKRKERLAGLSTIFWRHIAPEIRHEDSGTLVANKAVKYFLHSGGLAPTIGTFFDRPPGGQLVRYHQSGREVRFVFEGHPYLAFLDGYKNAVWFLWLKVPSGWSIGRNGDDFLMGRTPIGISPEMLVMEDNEMHSGRRVRLEEVTK